MWLVNCSTLELEFFVGSNIPKYAILSHTWEDEEVTFDELGHRSARSKQGYAKIKETCVQARRHGFQYAWIDTCCIDKSSSAELTESINSMFQWYQKAESCYVFLSDLHPAPRAEDGLATCRWFTRGWTLQELIAPAEVRFYDQKWSFIGTKKEFSSIISSITGIDQDVLLDYKLLRTYSVATRMSWAARRQTTRIEDLAYCLLGIFDVNMPMIYGEGPKAFRRLQEEIIRHSNDLTVFAWDQEQEEASPYGMFALSPAAFAESKNIRRLNRAYLDPVFAMTNKGLKFHHFVRPDEINLKEVTGYSIPLGGRFEGGGFTQINMQLRKIGRDLFIRNGRLLAVFGNPEHWAKASNIFLQTGILDALEVQSFKRQAIHFPVHGNLQILWAMPESHWDSTDRLFFAPLDDFEVVLAVYCDVILGASMVAVIVCIQFPANKVPICRIFYAGKHDQIDRRATWFFLRHKRFGHSVTWNDVQIEMPEILDLTNTVDVSTSDGQPFKISTSVSGEVIPSVSNEQIYTIRFAIEALVQSNDETVS